MEEHFVGVGRVHFEDQVGQDEVDYRCDAEVQIKLRNLKQIPQIFHHYYYKMWKDWEYLLIYTFSFLINGMVSGIIGPLIPFLASEANLSETDYYFVFLCRSGGALLAAIIYRISQNYGLLSDHHRLMGITSTAAFFCFIAFTVVKTPFLQGFLITLFAGLRYFQQIAQNCSVLMVASKERIFNWLSLCHSCFGIGSIIAPLVVSLFSKNAYVVAAVCIIITVPVYLFALKTPQEKQEEKLVNQQQQAEVEQNEVSNLKEVSTWTAVLLGANFFIFHGIESINGGWISSFVTMSGVGDKQTAALFATAFWITYTCTRLINTFLDFKVSTKLKRLNDLGVLSAIVCLIASLGSMKFLAAQLCVFLQGISVAGIFSLSLAIPYEFNLFTSEKYVSNVMLIMMMGEACIAGTTGFLMKHLGIQVFFLALILFNLLLLINGRMIVKTMEVEQPNSKENVKYKELQQFQEDVTA